MFFPSSVDDASLYGKEQPRNKIERRRRLIKRQRRAPEGNLQKLRHKIGSVGSWRAGKGWGEAGLGDGDEEEKEKEYEGR